VGRKVNKPSDLQMELHLKTMQKESLFIKILLDLPFSDFLILGVISELSSRLFGLHGHIFLRGLKGKRYCFDYPQNIVECICLNSLIVVNCNKVMFVAFRSWPAATLSCGRRDVYIQSPRCPLRPHTIGLINPDLSGAHVRQQCCLGIMAPAACGVGVTEGP
jgi:hypothetical protein